MTVRTNRFRPTSLAGIGSFIAILSCAGTVAAQAAGDADCNGTVELPADLTAVEAVLFTPGSCTGADANRDGVVSAPDVSGVLIAVAVAPSATPTGSAGVPTPTPTATAGLPSGGPEVTFFGLVNADGCAACNVANCLCLGTPTRTPEIDMQGRQVFETSMGTGFLLVVEGKPGLGRAPVGAFVPAPIPNSSLRPDLQIVADHDLGDGGRDICRDDGVPGINPLSFDERGEVTDSMIDLACRFQPMAPTQPCTFNHFGAMSALTPGGLPPGGRQFCLFVSDSLAFQAGTETVMAARLRDTDGDVGTGREIVVRVREP